MVGIIEVDGVGEGVGEVVKGFDKLIEKSKVDSFGESFLILFGIVESLVGVFGIGIDEGEGVG